MILPVLKDGAHSSGEDDKGAETVDVFKNKNMERRSTLFLG